MPSVRRFLGLIVRIVTHFRPLKFFGWPSALLTLGGVGVVTVWWRRTCSRAASAIVTRPAAGASWAVVTEPRTALPPLLAEPHIRSAYLGQL